MFDFQQKRKIRTIFTSRITQIILFGLSFLILWNVYERYLIARDVAERRVSLEAEIKKMEERKDSLEEEVKYISSERGVEAEMRRQFDIARDGEQVVIILDKEETATVTSNMDEDQDVGKSRPWYKFW